MTKEEREAKLIEKLATMKAFDNEHRAFTGEIIGGIDEVGRGPLAGPVVTACVVLPEDFNVIGIDDSKKLSEKKREELFSKIIEGAVAYGVGIVDNNLIDKINILEATKQAMLISCNECNKMLLNREFGPLSHVLIDAVKLDSLPCGQSNIIKGDAKSLSIAAASIVAKVTRDRMMYEYHEEYPYYAFDSNKGYGTKAHYEGIEKHGITPIHRKSFLKGII